VATELSVSGADNTRPRAGPAVKALLPNTNDCLLAAFHKALSVVEPNMNNVERVRRKQIIREAEGYLELISLFEDRWQLDPELRVRLADRAIG
jgi:hypothetical protein